MSSFRNSKSTMDFGIDPAELPSSLSLDRRKTDHYYAQDGQSCPTNFRRPESSYLGRFRMALLVACFTAFLISIRSYNPSRSPPASQDVFSSVCFPSVSRLVSSLPSRLYVLITQNLAERLPPSSLPPECLSGSPCHRFCHFGLGFLHIGIRAPWDPQSGHISRPDHGFRRHLRVHMLWNFDLQRRRRVGVQKLHAGIYHGDACHECGDTHIS